MNNCTFIQSAANLEQCPDHDLKEIVVVGRSNVGKSSFINTLFSHGKLAYVGKTPGKTRLLNFFNVDDRFCLVDVPGYGYAKISQQEILRFGEMMEDYFSQRQNLVGVIQLVDLRHKPTQDDLDMMEFIRYHEIPVLVVATKKDQCKNSEIIKNKKVILDTLQVEDCILFSSKTKVGVDEVFEQLNEIASMDEEAVV